MAVPLVDVNGVKYRWPKRPVAVVCIDGGDPAYLKQFLADGSVPNIARFMTQGFSTVADGTVPSATVLKPWVMKRAMFGTEPSARNCRR